jgi:hypothetical protein
MRRPRLTQSTLQGSSISVSGGGFSVDGGTAIVTRAGTYAIRHCWNAMICPSCRTQNRTGIAFCASRGGRLPVGVPQNRVGLAVAALLLGVISLPLLWGGGLGVAAGLAGAALGGWAFFKARREPMVYGGSRIAVAGVIVSALAVLLAPLRLSLLAPVHLDRLVERNEGRALADVRSVVAAEQAYSSLNHDRYDTLDGLVRPGACLLDHPASAPASFLDVALATTDSRDGYRRELRLGEAATPELGASISPSSITRFTYLAAFAALGVGVASGARACHSAVLGTLVFTLAAFYISWSSFGARRRFDAVPRALVPSDPQT